MKVSGGLKEDGIVVGNSYDKYGSRNPVVQWMMSGFNASLSDMVSQSAAKTIHEIGCGEGYWVVQWRQQGITASGSDFSAQVIDLARRNAVEEGLSPDIFKQRSIYDVSSQLDSAELIVCCEVLEHLEDPEEGLRSLNRIVNKYLILSVPREPVWCMLNMARGKYLSSLGNTPGHVQHWSRASFMKLVSKYFEIIDVKSPFPWTMLFCRVKDESLKIDG